ncbi:MAG: methylmalonyl-CoA mutase [Candidatus Lokiarchaeota archaeon]|nr:methylmalonyl-CoA mutase [Candidatus Lokiarchaeota archaeon]
MENIEKLEAEWTKKAKVDELKKHKNSSGIELKPIYTPVDLKGCKYEEVLGFPGKYPFTRGVYPTMYLGRKWTMRQYSGFQSARETNERYKYLLQQGQTGLSVAFDLPSQMGYDSDSELSIGEVGRTGVPITSLLDMEELFDGIPLNKVSTSMTINSPTAIMLAMYIALAEKQGVKLEDLRGTVQNDILKEYLARNTYIFPPEPSMRLVADVIEYCSNHLPNFNTISISGYHIREAGATAAQEVAFTIANAIAYVEEVLKRGLDFDQFATRLSFFWCTHNDFFEEIAKFRASRRVWAKIAKNRFSAKDPKSMMLRFHTQTIGSTLTAQQPLCNTVRVSIQTLAAVLGGAQSLHSSSYDEALCLPTEESVKLSLRTQQIIAFETGVANVIDPLGGSYYLETLTNQMEDEIFKIIKEIDAIGGAAKAIETGYIPKLIQDNSYKLQKRIESGEDIIVGVNKYIEDDDELRCQIFQRDTAIEKEQIEKVKKIKMKRDEKIVKEKLEQIRKVASDKVNMMPIFIDAVKNYVTTEEICNVLREVFGEYKQVKSI